MFELNHRYTYIVPTDVISGYGITQIKLYIASQNPQTGDWKVLNPTHVGDYLPMLPSDWQWSWLVTKGEFRGTLPKRIASYYHKRHGIKCPQWFLSEIGNLGKRHQETNATYCFEFVSRIDWEAGDFGDRGSCYWGEHAGTKQMIEDNGGMAIRFFKEDGTGYARAWVVEIEDSLYVLFNGYGLSTLAIARILAGFLKLDYKEIRLYNEDGYVLFINGNHGYTVGTLAALAELEEYDFGWENVYVATCENCGRPIYHEDDLYYGPEDGTYCVDCYSNLFESCAWCGDVHRPENLTYVESAGESYCSYCLERHFAECDHCHEFYRSGSLTEQDDQRYCGDCLTELSPPEGE